MFRWIWRPRGIIVLLVILLFSSFAVYLRVQKTMSPDFHEGLDISKKQSSLTFSNRKFFLDGQPLQIFSGAIHYFRIPQEYWRDRLLKLRAAGFNAVETYAPWNLHEEQRGVMSFSGRLDVRQFFKLAQEIGLYVIFRPGPFICSEWEFGGMPAWLLSDPNMRVRSMYVKFTQAVDDYFKMILNQISDLQFSKGGPIIAFQLENEYGSYGDNVQYLRYLANTLTRYGAVEAFFTSDSVDGIAHAHHLPEVFAGINYNQLHHGKRLMSIIRNWSKHLPLFATELWTGWFLGWGATKSEAIDTKPLLATIQQVLDQAGNINLYMFHGGTNFGFMNGYNGIDGVPLITSYDYGAPISESGQLTEKYHRIREMIFKYLPSSVVSSLPPIPKPIVSKDYGSRAIKSMMQWEHLVDLAIQPVLSDRIKLMEEVNQNFGFILYRSSFKGIAHKISIHGHIADRAVVLVNGATLNASCPLAGTVTNLKLNNAPALTELTLSSAALHSVDNKLDILVENLGRVNYASFQSTLFNKQRKGILAAASAAAAAPAAASADAAAAAAAPAAVALQSHGSVSIDDKQLHSYKIVSLDFSPSYMAKVSVDNDEWAAFQSPITASVAPAFYRTELEISSDEEPRDTFIDMTGWTKGVVFVNNINLGRYWNIGPQYTLYLPAPFLRKGVNQVLIFELHRPANSVTFTKAPKLKFSSSQSSSQSSGSNSGSKGSNDIVAVNNISNGNGSGSSSSSNISSKAANAA